MAGIANGGFESGQLGPWVDETSTPPAIVSNVHPHSGTYALLLNGPPQGSSSLENAVNQAISPALPLPMRVTGFMDVWTMPNRCDHPYHQFTVTDGSHAVEYGVAALSTGNYAFFGINGEIKFLVPVGNAPTGYRQFDVDIYSDHVDFWFDHQKVGTLNFCLGRLRPFSLLPAAMVAYGLTISVARRLEAT